MEERHDAVIEEIFGAELFDANAYAETYGTFEQVEAWEESVAALTQAVQALQRQRIDQVRASLDVGDGRDAKGELEASYKKRVSALVQSKKLVSGDAGVGPKLAVDPLLQKQLHAGRTQAVSQVPRRIDHVPQSGPRPAQQRHR